MHLKTTKKKYSCFTVIDFETTGFSCYENEVIEFAAVKVKDCRIADYISQLCKPVNPISRNITNLTGITNAMVKDSGSFAVYLPQLLDYFEDDVVVAHNAPFDVGFLRSYCSRAGVTFTNKTACTLAASRSALSGLPNYKLQTVSEHLRITNEDQHRALGDAMATAKILIHILNLNEIAV